MQRERSDSLNINQRGRPLSGRLPSRFSGRLSGRVNSSPNLGGENNQVIEIDLEDIRARLDRLRPLASTPIRLLSGDAKDDYTSLVNVTRLLYPTDSYDTYRQEVNSRFGDLTEIIPGTIGAYFAGCLLPTSWSGRESTQNPVCSAICAGSMPARGEDLENPESCAYTVILATPTADGYTFTPINQGENHDLLIVFLRSDDHRFAGFNESEKQQLATYGAHHVKIYRYSADGRNYTDVSNGMIQLQELPTRVDIIPNPTASSKVGSGNTLLIILLVILVIIALFVGWRIWATPK